MFPSIHDLKETGFTGLENQGAELAGHQHESQHPFQENNSGNVVDVTSISREFNFLQPVRRDLTSTEALNLEQEERVPLESIPHMSYHRTPPPPQALRPTSGTQSQSVNGSHHDIIVRSEDAAPTGKVGFLSYWVSSEVNDVEALSRTAISLEDFEQVGLDLSWLKQRLDEAKRVNKCSDSVVFTELCESALKVVRARVRELEEGLTKAKTEMEDRLRDLPNSLGVDDYVLKDVL
ncbi:hypothetical protein Acr_24g0007760 [Actinidia rufa]|uniref:Uncharacterized protein n=1 Tax=Actinidia rufa TaxID=165716 RepID=A0A7J0GUX2_9ERIC|nr:hypothetical protein Acr_24g0007760 [Actinidia rufa]